MEASALYEPRRAARSTFVDARGLRHHLLQWGGPADADDERPPLVLLHGWMDVAASYQFVVDALHALEGDRRWIIALDWRGFGRTEGPPVDAYWFPDYLGDLEAVLDAVVEPAMPGRPIDLAGHSMGGNVSMIYAGVRPARIRRLVNLEGFGMPASRPAQAPARYARWLDELRQPARLRPYARLEDVAARLCRNDPLLKPERAAWLARHWARRGDAPEGQEGAWVLQADAAHRRVNPELYQVESVLACWRGITAPLLWVEGDRTDVTGWWGGRYTKEEFHQRLDAAIPGVRKVMLSPSAHMLHHDQPEALAGHLLEFLGGR